MYKKFLVLVLLCFLVISSNSCVNACDSSDPYYYELPPKINFNLDNPIIGENGKTYYESDEIIVGDDTPVNETRQFRYGETYKVTEEGYSYVLAKVDGSYWLEPAGQAPGGVSFLNTTGSITINSEKGPKAEVSYGLGWGPTSVSFYIGKTVPASIANYTAVIPGDGKYYKVYMKKTIRVSHCKVEYYKYGELQDVYYRDYSKTYSRQFKREVQ